MLTMFLYYKVLFNFKYQFYDDTKIIPEKLSDICNFLFFIFLADK